MTREQWSRLAKSLFFRLFVLFLIFYTLYHCAQALSDRLTTDVVRRGSVKETIRGEATVFREETVVSVPGASYLISYPQENGAKLGRYQTVAQLYAVYASEAERAVVQQTLLSLDAQLRATEEAALGRHDTLAQLSDARADAMEQLRQLRILSTGGASGEQLRAAQNELLTRLQREEALLSPAVTAQTQKATLAARRTALLGGLMPSMTLTADQYAERSGCFYYADRVDGFEELFHRGALSGMTVAEYDDLMRRARTEGVQTYAGSTVVGKLSFGSQWSITLPVTAQVAEGLETGRSYEVGFDATGESVRMTLDRVIPSVADGRAILVLSATQMPADFACPRFCEVSLTLSETEGYRVPETALTEWEGESGVFILDGGRVSFRAVRIDYTGDGYVLVHIPDEQEREEDTEGFYDRDHYLRERDIVITSGKNLYDGKYMD